MGWDFGSRVAWTMIGRINDQHRSQSFSWKDMKAGPCQAWDWRGHAPYIPGGPSTNPCFAYFRRFHSGGHVDHSRRSHTHRHRLWFFGCQSHAEPDSTLALSRWNLPPCPAVCRQRRRFAGPSRSFFNPRVLQSWVTLVV